MKAPWLLMWAALLLPTPGTSGKSELPKAVVTLDPPWINVLQKDLVKLHCQGPYSPEDPKTHWFHNGSSMDTQGQPSVSFTANSNSSGSYSCQMNGSLLSDPVQLTVISDWLLLQTTALQFQEGDPIVLRCHSWQNRPLVKVSFFQDGQAKNFSHYDQKFSISKANLSHSGKYSCRGYIGRKEHNSKPVAIAVLGGHTTDTGAPTSLKSLIVTVVAVLAVVAVVLGVAAWWSLRRKKFSVACPNAEEVSKKETENTITYSILTHPEEETPKYLNST
ncbi:low affinity immunoglobulin gamma Fc region receptor II-like [Suncus etruscus]|uniref:low affinity immunoglobulin gamma Fc region receptor II-like n=1 Tax=Suncus etruscus TaxID=109475 RepID=UPI0021100CFB|nr:low affinity immunoglobulin gamma Fc region receptor II-like [Suncus etruscus]